jgi:hypothetical protein
MKTLPIAAALLVAVLSSSSMGCSSSETKDPVPSTGTPGATETPAPADTAADPPAADPAPAATPTVKAPTIQQIMKMAGALHVSWTNAEPSCDAIELERMTSTVAWKVVATLPGEADNKHDATATGATMYTYRVRCKKASVYSAYSNEMSASPK